jgi:hypothetical protein
MPAFSGGVNMVKKPGKGLKTATTARAKALDANITALARHTKALNRNTAALATHTAMLSSVGPKQLVYSVLGEPLTLPDTTPLSKLDLDFGALAGTAVAIRARGVKVDTGLVQACTTIADLVKVVAAAMAKGA